MRGLLALTVVLATACSPSGAVPGPASGTAGKPVRSFAYQLQGYPGGRLDHLAKAPHDLAIIDLSRDATVPGYFGREEIERLRRTGKKVLAYFEIGSIEEFRTEFPATDGLRLNRWDEWPDEHFVRFWEPAWWDRVIRPRVDQAVRAGFDGVYLDTPLAYEEIDLKLVPGESRASLARRMADLVIRISRHAPGLLVFPQNSPELREQRGYTEAIDGIGMEDLFFRDDRPCTEDWCAENLAGAKALRELGKTVLATDYATSPANVRAACAKYAEHGFAGNVTTLDLDHIGRPCNA
ncbi:endo alpha-1,4 polygalactosaminidase [Nonomuraea sp. NPDC050310]|uniref:endo alpha-1,4 polygalactosaminidase n=1 Tax=Nonomuraea sp. NPDC050310 TaxID=3154935 RepID=UPI0033F0A4A8